MLEGQELQTALRARLAMRPHLAWPKRKREMHIFLAYCQSNWEFILPRALSPFGKVTTFQWRERGFDDTAPNWLDRRTAMNEAMLAAFHTANKEQPIDAVVGYLSGANTNPGTLGEMASAGAAIFNFCWDDKLGFPGRFVGGQSASPAAIAHVVDLNLTNAPSSLVKYAVHDGLAMFFPEAAQPDFHKPHDVPFDFDVSFVGARYGCAANLSMNCSTAWLPQELRSNALAAVGPMACYRMKTSSSFTRAAASISVSPASVIRGK